MAQFKDKELSQEQQDKLDAAVFRRFLAHLDQHKEVQNIDLMILADFCRNCLCKWYKAEADSQNLAVDMDEAQARIYGMSYEQWKRDHQLPATPEQLAAYQEKQKK